MAIHGGEAKAIVDPSPDDRRKLLGIYYTPDALTRVLTGWAIRSANDRILEPSFGGCGFITAALNQLSEFGATKPISQIYGCDVDPAAYETLGRTLVTELPGKNFLIQDFLQTTKKSWSPSNFDVVLGNPPYVSHHNMNHDQKIRAKEALLRTECTLSGTASLWAYFVLHSISFLNQGGRLAFILPISFLTSLYAKKIQNLLIEHFSSTLIIRKHFHSFKAAGASERTIAVLADGYSKDEISGKMQIVSAASMSDFEDAALGKTSSSEVINGTSQRKFMRRGLPPLSFERELQDHQSASISDLMKVEIGLVTGANKFFIVSQKTVNDWRLPKRALLPILARSADCDGLEYTDEDKERANAESKRCWLFRPTTLGERGGAIRRYLGSVPKDIRCNTAWFKKRKNWYAPEGYASPNAFITYMNHLGPRLILNTACVDCTNTLHRVNFGDSISHNREKLIAVSLQTTFSQISAERVGRVYGGGVLKLEPSELRRLRVLVPQTMHHQSISKAFRLVNRFLRARDPDAARKTADEAILGALFGNDIPTSVISELDSSLKLLRSERLS